MSAFPFFVPAMFAIPLVFFAVLAVLVILVIIAIIGQRAAIKRRRDQLHTFAAARGFTFMAEDLLGLRDRMGVFALMRRGHSKKVRHVLIGDHGGRQIILFEYVYVTGGGKDSHTHTQYCCTWQAPAAVSRLMVRPEGFFDRIGDWFTGKDIDFPDDPAFSDAYVVSGDDEAEVRGLLTPAVREFAMRNSLESLEMVGDLALLYGRGGSLEVRRCEELLRLSEGLDRVLAGRGGA
jgi:hypothetical protein